MNSIPAPRTSSMMFLSFHALSGNRVKTLKLWTQTNPSFIKSIFFSEVSCHGEGEAEDRKRLGQECATSTHGMTVLIKETQRLRLLLSPCEEAASMNQKWTLASP